MMRRRLSISNSLLALVLAASLLLPLPVQAAETGNGENGTGETVHIRTEEDWNELARHCTLDTWSRGKTVVLDGDLDLKDSVCLPTFGGVLEGGGHTISGLSLEGEGSCQGLIRSVQEGAVIRQLHVAGRVAPGGSWEILGGIAGVNRGTISGCSFQGVVRGGGSAGGIAGVNEAAGQIVLCTAGGLVSGGHSTGGIAGENYGSLSQCTNQALVNTQEADASPELDAIDWSKLNSTQNFPACTDTGGITGFSKGSVQDCVNRGQVGYPHTGYNVGGIAGRQSGYLAGCVNEARVQGRKDVGGIVGQMEPYTLLRYEETTLRALADHLDTLGSLLNGALDNTDLTRRQLSEQVSRLTGLTGEARTGVSALMDQLGGLAEGTADTANDLTGRIAEVLEASSPIAGSLSRGTDTLSEAVGALEDVLDAAGGTDEDLSAALREARTALTELRAAQSDLDSAVKTLKGGLGGGKPLETLRTALDSLGSIPGHLRSAVDGLDGALPHLRAAGSASGEALEALRPVVNGVEQGGQGLSRAMEDLEDLLARQAEKPLLSFPKLDSDFYAQEDRLGETLSGLTESMETLNRTVDSGGGRLAEDLRQINGQFGAVADLLRDAAAEDRTNRELVVDISEEEVSAATLGKVFRCENRGAVEGDLNVGGAAGAMSIEFDFDPEDDTARQGESSLSFQYLTRAILLDCVNRGSVTARKDCAGGAAGRMELGLLEGCENYGSVESTTGGYAGGVAGSSASVIRGSWAKCEVKGESRVGGIAGSCKDLSGCGAMVRLPEQGACRGSVAGESSGTLTENYFVGELPGGVDGISRGGQAEPLDYEAFMDLPGVPEDFSRFTLTFTADGETAAQVPFRYGDALSELPAVPEKEGHFGAWEPFDRDCLLFDAVIEAKYTPWITLLEDNSVLAEGRFTPEDALTVTEEQAEDGALGQWTVEGTGTFTALRLPGGVRKAQVWRLTEQGTWEALETEKVGSCFRAELEGSRAVVRLTEADSGWLLPLAVLLLLAAGGVLLLVQRKRRRRKAQSPSASPAGPSAV